MPQQPVKSLKAHRLAWRANLFEKVGWWYGFSLDQISRLSAPASKRYGQSHRCVLFRETIGKDVKEWLLSARSGDQRGSQCHAEASHSSDNFYAERLIVAETSWRCQSIRQLPHSGF